LKGIGREENRRERRSGVEKQKVRRGADHSEHSFNRQIESLFTTAAPSSREQGKESFAVECQKQNEFGEIETKRRTRRVDSNWQRQSAATRRRFKLFFFFFVRVLFFAEQSELGERGGSVLEKATQSIRVQCVRSPTRRTQPGLLSPLAIGLARLVHRTRRRDQRQVVLVGHERQIGHGRLGVAQVEAVFPALLARDLQLGAQRGAQKWKGASTSRLGLECQPGAGNRSPFNRFLSTLALIRFTFKKKDSVDEVVKVEDEVKMHKRRQQFNQSIQTFVPMPFLPEIQYPTVRIVSSC